MPFTWPFNSETKPFSNEIERGRLKRMLWKPPGRSSKTLHPRRWRRRPTVMMTNLARPLLAGLLLLLTTLDGDLTTNLSSLLGVVEQWRPQDVRVSFVHS